MEKEKNKNKQKNKNKNSSQIGSVQFMGIWIVGSIVAAPLLALMGTLILVIFKSNEFGHYYTSFFIEPSYNFIDKALVGAAIGASIGYLEKIVIQRYFHAEVSNWSQLSTMGGVVAALLDTLLLDVPWTQDFDTTHILLGLVIGSIFAVFSVFQWIALRKQVHDTWLWILAHFISGFAGMLLADNVVAILYSYIPADTILSIYLLIELEVLLTALAFGAITGGTLLWLFQNRWIAIDKLKTEEFSSNDDLTTSRKGKHGKNEK